MVVYFSIQGKIEVKILTRKNAEEAGEQWLTEEDTKSFRELLISLLVTHSCCFAACCPAAGADHLKAPRSVFASSSLDGFTSVIIR